MMGLKGQVFRREYCHNCHDAVATIRLVCDDMFALVCDECYEKRPEGWEERPDENAEDRG